MAPVGTAVTIRLTEPVVSMIGGIEYERARLRRRRDVNRSTRAQQTNTTGSTNTTALAENIPSRPTSPERSDPLPQPLSRPPSQSGSRTQSPIRGRHNFAAESNFVPPGPGRGRSTSRGDSLSRREDSRTRAPREAVTTTGSGTLEEAQAVDEPPPAMLRGLLMVTLAKPCRVRDITVKLRGISRTDWPEGIGPRRLDVMEETSLLHMSFTFFSASDRSSERRAVSIGPGTGGETHHAERGRSSARRAASLMPSRELSTGGAYQSFDSATHNEEWSSASQPIPSQREDRHHSVLSRIPSSTDLEDGHQTNAVPIQPGESAPAYEAVPSNPGSPAESTRATSPPGFNRNLSSDTFDLNGAAERTHLPHLTRMERSPTPNGSPLNPSSRASTLTNGGLISSRSGDGRLIQNTNRLTESPPSTPLGRNIVMHTPSVGNCSPNQSSPSPSVAELFPSDSDVEGQTGWNSAPVAGSTTSSFDRGRPPVRPGFVGMESLGIRIEEDSERPSTTNHVIRDASTGPTFTAPIFQSLASQRTPSPAQNGAHGIDVSRSRSRGSTNRTTSPSLPSTLPSAIRDLSSIGPGGSSQASNSKIGKRFSLAGMADALKVKNVARARESGSFTDTTVRDRSNGRAPRGESPDARASGTGIRDQSRGRRKAMKVLRNALMTGNDVDHDNSDEEEVVYKGKGKAAVAWKEFRAGTYTYPISIPVQASLPPSISADFGYVAYSLKATVHRAGALTSNLSASTEIPLISCPSQDDAEENESIVIERFWETQMKYHVALSGKNFPIGSNIPIAIRLNPMAKIKLYRITAQLEQKTAYFAAGRKLSRHETPKKYPLLRIENHDPKEPLLPILSDDPNAIANHPLAAWFVNPTSSDDTLPQCLDPIGPWHLESHLKLPTCQAKLNFSTAHERANIAISHVLTIVLRVERGDDEFLDSKGRRKLWDVIIETPIHVLSCRCPQNILPPYSANNSSVGLSSSSFSNARDCGYNHSYMAHRASGPINISKTMSQNVPGGAKASSSPGVAPVATLEQNLLFARLVAGEETPAGEVPPTYNAVITGEVQDERLNLERSSSSISSGTARDRSSSTSGDGTSQTRGRDTRSGSMVGGQMYIGRSGSRSEHSLSVGGRG